MRLLGFTHSASDTDNAYSTFFSGRCDACSTGGKAGLPSPCKFWQRSRTPFGLAAVDEPLTALPPPGCVRHERQAALGSRPRSCARDGFDGNPRLRGMRDIETEPARASNSSCVITSARRGHPPRERDSGLAGSARPRNPPHTRAPDGHGDRRGLPERAVSDPRAAEILLRWLQRPGRETRSGGVDLDSLSEPQLERLYAGC
jgi:hypothetical protein